MNKKIPGRRGSMRNRPAPEPIKLPMMLIREGTIGDCPNCGSTTVKRFFWFGRGIGCISPNCKYYYKKFEKKRRKNLKKSY